MEINRRKFLALATAGLASTAVVANTGPVLAGDNSSGSKRTVSYGMLVDTTMCVGCRACVVACKQWNHNPVSSYDDPERDRTINAVPLLKADTFTNIRATEIADSTGPQWIYTKIQCMHCEHPACAKACIVGALVKTPNGPVTYDETKCIGCRYCMTACPFGIPNFEWEKTVPWIRKCTFCASRQEQGLQPACSGTCPTGALKFGTRENLLVEAKKRISANPELYEQHIYGETEVGGTSWIYLASVPFDMLGLNKYREEPVTVNVQRAMGVIPFVLGGVAVLMSSIYLFIQRRAKQRGDNSDNTNTSNKR